MTDLAQLIVRLSVIGGCGCGDCIVIRPRGMAPVGCCRCSTDSRTMSRVLHAYQAALGLPHAPQERALQAQQETSEDE